MKRQEPWLCPEDAEAEAGAGRRRKGCVILRTALVSLRMTPVIWHGGVAAPREILHGLKAIQDDATEKQDDATL